LAIDGIAKNQETGLPYLIFSIPAIPNPDRPEPNKDFTTKHTKGTKNEFLMVLWSFRVLRDLRGLRPIGPYAPAGEQISRYYGHITNLSQR